MSDIPEFSYTAQQEAQVRHAVHAAVEALRDIGRQGLLLTEEQAEDIRLIVDILAPTAKGKKLTKPPRSSK